MWIRYEYSLNMKVKYTNKRTHFVAGWTLRRLISGWTVFNSAGLEQISQTEVANKRIIYTQKELSVRSLKRACIQP